MWFGVWNVEFGTWGSGFGFWGLGSGVVGWICGCELRGWGFGGYRLDRALGAHLLGEVQRAHQLRNRVQGSGFRVQGSGFRVQGSGFRVQGSGFRVQGPVFRVQCSGLRVGVWVLGSVI